MTGANPVPMLKVCPTMQSYWLNPRVHFCTCDNALIFLDVARDIYFRLTGKQREWFELLCRARDPGDLPEEAGAFAERLLARDVLTRDPAGGKSLTAASFAPPSACLSKLASTAEPSRILKTALALSVAAVSSWCVERSGTFENVVNSVTRWKQDIRPTGSASLEHVLELAARFHAMTPYFFSIRDACRYRSIVLVKYLTLFGIAPDWVFGVRLCPFGAHCWVEYQSVILNDDTDTVCEFRPIMSV